MTLANSKDAQRLEVVRYHTETSHPFHSVLKQPLEDLEQRTKDLEAMLGPARAFRARAEDPPSGTVEIESGWYVTAGTTIAEAPLNTAAIPAASGGNIRIDLLWVEAIDPTTVNRVAGGEGAAGGGFAALTRPDLPASASQGISLAYVYVDETPTPFADTIALNTAGHIQDVRPGPGFVLGRVFEDTAGNLQPDTSSGVVGTSNKLVRAAHVHPANVDATNPSGPADPATVGTSGVSTVYAREDHVHSIAMEASAANLVQAGTADLGVRDFLVRSDHRHPLNVSATNPTTVAGPGAGGAAGSSLVYSRSDHVHDLPAANPYTTAPASFLVAFGGDVSGSNVYLLAWNEEAIIALTASTLGLTRFIAPIACTIKQAIWSKENGGSATFEVRVAGSVEDTLSGLTGGSGSEDVDIAVAQGEAVEVNHSAGVDADLTRFWLRCEI
jgi:hypothetical protein